MSANKNNMQKPEVAKSEEFFSDEVAEKTEQTSEKTEQTSVKEELLEEEVKTSDPVNAPKTPSGFGDAVVDMSRPLVDKGRATYATLMAEENVPIFVPLDDSDAPTRDWNINGVRFTVPTNRIILVPKSLAQAIDNSINPVR